MFTKKQSTNTVGVSNAIDELLVEMHEQDKDSDIYAVMVSQLEKLYGLKEIDCKVDSVSRVSMDTLTIVSGNVLGILMIVGHERANVVTSKALTLLTKLR